MIINPLVTPNFMAPKAQGPISRMSGNSPSAGGAVGYVSGSVLREWYFDDLTGVVNDSDVMDGGTVLNSITGLNPAKTNCVRIAARALGLQPAPPNDQDDAGWWGDVQDLVNQGTSVYGFVYRVGSNFLPFSGKYFMERPMDTGDPGVEIHASMNMWHVRGCTDDLTPATDEMPHAIVQAPGGSGIDENGTGPWYNCSHAIDMFDHIDEWVYVEVKNIYGTSMTATIWLQDGTSVTMTRNDSSYPGTVSDPAAELYAGRFRLGAYISATNGSTDSQNPYGATVDANTTTDFYYACFGNADIGPPSWFLT